MLEAMKRMKKEARSLLLNSGMGGLRHSRPQPDTAMRRASEPNKKQLIAVSFPGFANCSWLMRFCRNPLGAKKELASASS